MDMTYASSFLLGGVSTVTLMGLLLLFIGKPPKKSKDAQYLRQVAATLLNLTGCKDSVESARLGDVEETEGRTSQPADNPIPPNPSSADGRWGMGYTPFPGLL